MKRILTLTLALLLILALAACGSKPAETPAQAAPEENWGITLTAEEVTPTSLLLTITQSGGSPTGQLQCGSEFTLEVDQDSTWQPVPYLENAGDIAWTMEAYPIPANDSLQLMNGWTRFYGELPAGNYRLVKTIQDVREAGDFDEETYYAYFTID